LEVKARCHDLSAARATIHQLGARPADVQVQIDTYFRVPNSRLKLRQIQGQSDELISYDRPDQREARISSYHRVPVGDAEGLKALLIAALGLRGEVRKRREVCLWHNVRIHLDLVTGLGTFVEFEAVLSAGETEAASRILLDQLCRELAICPGDTFAGSYADLMGF
jgi:predicted adenylyl cyclase CyaB